jgi:hypothetical protein
MYPTARQRQIYAIKKAKSKSSASTKKAKSGFSIGVPGLINIGANWKRPKSSMSLRPRSYGRGSSVLTRIPQTARASIPRSMRYGQSYNAGAVAVGLDEGIVHVKHREFLGTIDSSIAFKTQVFELNPGLSRLMPWGSSIANSFQQYTIKSMVFEFVSTSATSLVSGTNTALGQVSIATQYDSIQPDFRNLNDMLNSQFATSTKISSDLVHAVETERYQTTALPLYTRSGRVPGDIRLYDMGKTTFATYGAQADNNQIGQLWISYDICFFKPIAYNLDGGNAESAFYTCYPFNNVFLSPSSPLGGASFADMDNIGVLINQTPLQQSITLPAGSSGYYQFVFSYFSSGDIATGPILRPAFGAVNYVNCEIVNNLYNQNPNLPLAGQPAVAGNSPILSTCLTNAPNFTFIINVIDPNEEAVIRFDTPAPPNTWSSLLTGVQTSPAACLNISISQLNIGYSKWQPPPKDIDNSACCQSLQAQIDALTLLVQTLQTEVDEVEQCCESDSEEERIQNRRIERLEHKVEHCCGDSPCEESPKASTPDLS